MRKILVASMLLMAALLTPEAAAREHEPRLVAPSSLRAPILGSEFVISNIDNVKQSPAVAYNTKHDQFLVVWQNNWPGNYDIYAWRVSSRGQLLSWFAVAAGSQNYLRPSVDYDPDQDRYLVVWDQLGSPSPGIYGRFIPWNGPTDSLPPFPISSAPDAYGPRVAFANTQHEFFVVWTQLVTSFGAYVAGRRVSANGGCVGNVFPVSGGYVDQSRAEVAYNWHRNEYLVVYDSGGVDIYGVRLSATDGSILSPGDFAIADWPDPELFAAVAACYAADQYLVAWQSYHTETSYDIYARFVRGDGTPDSVNLISDDPRREVGVYVACLGAGQQYLVTWMQAEFSPQSYSILSRQLFPDHTMNSAFPVTPPISGWPTGGVPYAPGYEAVAGGSTSFLVAWIHDRGGASYEDLHGRFVTPFGLFLPLIGR